MKITKYLAIPLSTIAIITSSFNSFVMSQEQFTVTAVPAENGSYTISPELHETGKVDAGTVLTIQAKPDSGYSLDAVYYTVKGGMWGTTSYESMNPKMQVTVDRDMSIGAVFINESLVKNLNITHDVVYAKPGVKALKYDVYAPKNAQNLPCVIIIHGGGWSSNNEDIMRGLARQLTATNNYVVFSIDYRWVNRLDGDEQPNYMHNLIEDVFGAIAHIQEHASQYGGNPTKIAVTGDSAGGHLSEAAAVLSPYIGVGGFGKKEDVYEYRPTYIPKDKTVEQVKEEITSSIKAVAPSYGPSDASSFNMFIEQKDPAYLNAVSPIKHVPDSSERELPHFMVRGTEDPVIPHEVVQDYVDVLKAKGHHAIYIQVEGAGHAFFDWKPDAETRATFVKYGIPNADRMREFFDSVFYEE